MRPTIYADTLFLFNFLLDSAVLIITQRLLKKEINILKTAVGAGFGGVYAVFMFFPKTSFLYSALSKISVLFGISYLVFGGDNFKDALKRFGVFMGVNLSLGGTLLALIFLTDFGTAVGSVVSGGGVYLNLSPLVLILGIVLTYTLLGIYSQKRKEALFEKGLIKRFGITYNNKTCEINVFLDTGCKLKDPISDRGALVVEYDKLKLILSEKEREIVEENKGIDEAFKEGMRMLPFSTLSGENMIYAIVAETLTSEGESWNNVCVGLITKRRLGEDYGGIINPRLYLENGRNMEERMV